jgi:dipeptidyl aminopeptidase/acylaminoacyl peptidase
MKTLMCSFIAVLGLVAAVRADEPKPEKPVLRLPGRVVVKSAGKEIGELAGRTLAVAFSSDGRRLAAASSRGGVDLAKQPYPPLTTNDLPSAYAAIKLWDARTGKELRDQIDGFPGGVAAFSHDGKQLVIAYSGGLPPGDAIPSENIKVWDVASGKELLSLKWHEPHIECLAISSDGQRLAAGGTNIKVWDAKTGKELYAFSGLSGEAFCLAFSSDNRRLAVGTRNFADQVKAGGIRGEARFWDLATGKPAATWGPHGQYVKTLAYGPDGKWLALGILTVDQEAPVKICDAETGRELLRLPDQGKVSRQAQAQQLAFSPDCRLIAVVLSEQDKTAVKVWDAKTGKLRQTLPADDADSCLAFAPDGARLAVGNTREITVWEIGP